MRKPAHALVALAFLLPLTGCGEDPVDAYCSRLEADRPKIAAMVDSASPSPLLGNRRLLHDLADAAPSDVADEWQTFLAALDGLQKALDRAGVKPSEFVGGKPPGNLTAAQRGGIADAVAQLGTDDTLAAASGIEQQARDVCKVNFGL
ncbi:MAG: hypothetical protein JWR42_1366 [Marmoricola sp.]|nr:hypothetical protein [Marmoricola sp.]